MTRSKTNVLCGVYAIVNTVTRQVYVGGSVDLFARMREHFRTLRLNSHSNRRLQYSFNKYGDAAFKWFIIEKCDRSIRFEREQFWMDQLGVIKIGFNIRPRADFKEVSEETKRKISKGLMGHAVSDRCRQVMALLGRQRRGETRSQEWRDKIAASLRGRKRPYMSEEWRRKVANNGKPRPVSCYDLKGVFVGTFPRIIDAAQQLTNGRRSAISLCLAGLQKTAYGYIWTDAREP